MFQKLKPLKTDNLYTNKKTSFLNSSTVEIGISYDHSLIFAMFRLTFCKGPSRFIYYRPYNNYNKEEFKNAFKQRLVSSSNFEEFFDTLLATLKSSHH